MTDSGFAPVMANGIPGFWGIPEDKIVSQDEESLRRIHYFLYEEYKNNRYGSPIKEALKTIYYHLKPLMSRKLQFALRNCWRRAVQDRISFPAWPVDLTLMKIYEEGLSGLCESDPEIEPAPFWQNSLRSVAVATHDVEGTAGLKNIIRLARLEADLGVRALISFVPLRSAPDAGLLDELRAMGHEIGVHGCNHDGHLFRDRKTFIERLPVISRYAREWGAKGFRSPATHRHPSWMQELPFLYDTSYFDTDPYEVQYGGSLSLFPFFLGRLVELPITLTQDYTVFEMLKHTDLSLWYEKSKVIIEHRGMILWVIHPDYIFKGDRLDHYLDFLRWIKDQDGVEVMLPGEVAVWWRDRAISSGWLSRSNS